jgi:hypothetical protein
MVAIAEETSLPGGVVWPWAIINVVNQAGYRNIAATLGMAGLKRKGLIEEIETETGNYGDDTAMALRITNNGWMWLEANAGRVEIRIPHSEPLPQPEQAEAQQNDDIPF